MNRTGQIAHNNFTQPSDALERFLKDERPLLYSAMFPKRIQSPHNYLNPRHFATCASCMYRLWMRPDMKLLPHTTGMMVALAMSKYQMPTYFIEPVFAEAVMQSRMPDDFYLKDIKWPMPAMLFVLPDAFIQKYFLYYLPFLAVAKAPAGIYPQNYHPYPQTEEQIQFGSHLSVSTDRILMHFPLFSTTSAPVDYTGNYPLDSPISIIEEASYTNAVPFEEEMYQLHYQAPLTFPSTGPVDETEDLKLQVELTSFTIKLMLAITARPEYIEAERIARPENPNPRKRQEALYYPRMVGTPFRVLRPPSTGGVSTGRKMPMYWHPGGWTHQVIGKRDDFISISELPHTPEGKVDWSAIPDAIREKFWRSHKFKWIESYLVNAPVADAETPSLNEQRKIA